MRNQADDPRGRCRSGALDRVRSSRPIMAATGGRRARRRTLAAALLTALVLVGPAGAAGVSTWKEVGSLTTARAGMVSGVLPDGKVLVAGGIDATGTSLATSETFDPASDTWSIGPAMSTARVQAVAVSLANGDLFIAGGQSTSLQASALNTAEVYDPTSNSFTPVSNTMSSPRTQASAVLLADGDVLVLGGADQNGDPLASAELYDPTTNSFLTGPAAAASMSAPRLLPAVAVLGNGDVLVAGGADPSFAPQATAELYDPATNSWKPAANAMSVPRAAAGAAVLPDGTVLIAGGESEDSGTLTASATTDIYDPTTNGFTAGPSMNTGRALFATDALHDGRVLVAGGVTIQQGTESTTSSVEIYDPSTQQWSDTTPLTQGVIETATAVLPNGDVLEAGGAPGLGNPAAETASASLYIVPSAPAAPTAVSAIPQDGSALVTFVPPDDGGEPIATYTVTASTGQSVTTADARTFAIVTGLTNGTPVTFTIRATNREGTGPASAPSGSITPEAPPSTPTTTTTTTVAQPTTVTTTTTVTTPAPTTTVPTTTTPRTASIPDRAPKLRLAGVRAQISLKQFLKGFRFSVTPDKAASLQITLLATVNQATIARAFNLTLAHKALGASARRRTITLRPSTKIVDKTRRVRVRLVVVATDTAGSRSTLTRTVTIMR